MKDINKNDIIREKLAAAHTSPLQAYRNLTTGNSSLGFFALLITDISIRILVWRARFSAAQDFLPRFI